MTNHDREPAVVSNPYKGLEPFTDADLLFGRSEDQQRLVYSLQSSRLTILYGDKAVGKSSILRAGIAKELRQLSTKQKDRGQLDSGTDPRIEEPFVPESAVVLFDDWSHPDIIPRMSTLIDEELARIGARTRHDLEAKNFLDRCKSWTECLGKKGDGGELFLLLDQFDDYLLSNSRLSTTCGTFDFEFSRVISTRGLGVNCLITIREGLLASLDRYRRTIPNLYSSLIRLEPLNKKQAMDAIQSPVYAGYNSTHQDSRIGIEAELVGAVLNAARLDSDARLPDARQSAASDEQFDAGSLQLVMSAVWDAEAAQGSQTLRCRTFNEKLGGILGIASHYVEQRLGTLASRDQHLAAVIFEHLVTSGGIGVTRQLSDLAGRFGITASEVEILTTELSKRRVIAVVPGRSPGLVSYEMAHRILVPAIVDRVRRYLAAKANEEQRLGSEIEKSLRLFYGKSQLDGLNRIVRAGDDCSAKRKELLISEESELHIHLQNALRKIVNNLEQKTQLGGYKGAVSSIAYSPDGRFLVTGAEDGSVAFWNTRFPAQGPMSYTDKHKTWIWALQTSADGRWLASGSDDGTVALWVSSDRGFSYRSSVPSDAGAPLVRGLSFSPRDPFLAIATTDGDIRLWHLLEEKSILEFTASHLGIRCVEFSPDGLSLATGGDDGAIRLWDLHGNALERSSGDSCLRHDYAVWRIRFHPDGKRLASCSEDHTIKLWNLESGREEQTLVGHTCWVLNIAFSSSGRLLASASEDGTARLWDEKGNQVATFMHGAPVNSLCFSPDDLTLATAAADCKVRLWSVGKNPDSQRPRVFRHSGKAILLDVGASSDGRYLATGATDREVQIWDQEGNVARRLVGHRHWIMSLVFHPSEPEVLATGSTDGTARVWNIVDGTSVEFAPLDGPVWSVAFSPNGDFLCTGSNGGQICVWNLRSPNDTAVVRFPSGQGAVWSIRFSPDGQSIVAGCQDGSIQIRKLTGEHVMKLTGVHAGQVLSLSFNPDNRLLASSSSEGTICIWDLARQEAKWVHDLGAPVWGIAFSPNGKILASGSVDRSVSLWDLEGERVDGWSADGPIRGLSFTRPDGKWLAGACSDGTVRLWPIDRDNAESLLARAKLELERSVSVIQS